MSADFIAEIEVCNFCSEDEWDAAIDLIESVINFEEHVEFYVDAKNVGWRNLDAHWHFQADNAVDFVRGVVNLDAEWAATLHVPENLDKDTIFVEVKHHDSPTGELRMVRTADAYINLYALTLSNKEDGVLFLSGLRNSPDNWIWEDGMPIPVDVDWASEDGRDAGEYDAEYYRYVLDGLITDDKVRNLDDAIDHYISAARATVVHTNSIIDEKTASELGYDVSDFEGAVELVTEVQLPYHVVDEIVSALYDIRAHADYDGWHATLSKTYEDITARIGIAEQGAVADTQFWIKPIDYVDAEPLFEGDIVDHSTPVEVVVGEDLIEFNIICETGHKRFEHFAYVTVSKFTKNILEPVQKGD